MAYRTMDLAEYANSLYQAENFEEAFAALEKQVVKLGFEGVLYTHIPRILLDSNFPCNPVYKVSQNYNPSYLKHYAEAEFHRNDPLIKAVNQGVREPIDWWGNINKKYMEMNKDSKAVIATSRDYGITNGITLPLMSGELGVSGASFISSEQRSYQNLKQENLKTLKICTLMFHHMVSSNACFSGHFIKPILELLNNTEQQFLRMLAKGETPAQIAHKLGKSEKYLEQVMLKLRRKLSGSANDESAPFNRNQILYYAGLLNLIEHIS